MSDYVVTIICTIGISLAFGLAWSISADSIVNACDKQGSFYVGDLVYECKLKEKNS